VTKKQNINIDVDKLRDIAHTGVRRAILFMGLGLNAASREDFNDYELRKLPIDPGQTSLPIEFFPENLPADRVLAFKESFATWIVGCGLRELLEHYALFLDQIHRYALLVFQVKGKLGRINPIKEQQLFNRRLGIPDKLATLHKRFSIAPSDQESINQLYDARNCLAHDLGIIGSQRCDPDGNLTLTWRTLDVIARGDTTGTEHLIVNLIGKKTEEPLSIIMQQVVRERKFAAGAKLALTKQDVWEICFFFNAHAIPSAIRSFVKFLKAHDIELREP